MPDVPMTVLRHSSATSSAGAARVNRAEPDAPTAEDQHQQP